MQFYRNVENVSNNLSKPIFLLWIVNTNKRVINDMDRTTNAIVNKHVNIN